MKTRTSVKAGRLSSNHNETLVKASGKSEGLKVRTQIKAGRLAGNHNETLVREAE